jgi:hypothetical protein
MEIGDRRSEREKEGAETAGPFSLPFKIQKFSISSIPYLRDMTGF